MYDEKHNERMSATQDAMLWARERAAAGVHSDLYALDEEILSIKRYTSGGHDVWVTERKTEDGRAFECSRSAWGCPGDLMVGEERQQWIDRRLAELD